jgi:hypothetical protein
MCDESVILPAAAKPLFPMLGTVFQDCFKERALSAGAVCPHQGFSNHELCTPPISPPRFSRSSIVRILNGLDAPCLKVTGSRRATSDRVRRRASDAACAGRVRISATA